MTMSIGIVLLGAIAEEMRAHELGVAPDRTRVRWLEATSPTSDADGARPAVTGSKRPSRTTRAITTNPDVPHLFWGSPSR